METVGILTMEERFSERTQWSRVLPQLGAAVLLGAVLGWKFGWAGVLPAVFLLLALLGEALFATLGLLAVLGFAFIQPFDLLPDEWGIAAGTQVILEMVELTNSPVLLAIPLFTLAGAIMTHGGISRRLVRVMRATMGWLPGGVALATILACAFFAALSGSSAVTIIAVGGMLAPNLERDYGRSFSLGLLTSCGAIGILAPPSLPLIIYGVFAEVDVNSLFIAAIIPGVLTVTFLGVYSAIRGMKLPRQAFDLRELVGACREGALALALPPLLLLVIFTGLVTPAEASVLAVVYALIVECVIHREVALKALPQIAIDTMMLVGSILIILLMALAFSAFLKAEQVPQQATALIQDVIHTKIGFLLALNVLLLAVGCVMDIFSAIVVMTPLVLPIAQSFGVDPVHLGIIMVVNLELGFATPPFGINLFISSAFFRRPVAEIFKATLPFLGLLMVALLLITWWEPLSLWLVGISGLG